MSLVRINWRPDSGELRKFGIAMLAGFGVVALILYVKDYRLATMVSLGIGLVVGTIGLSGLRIALPFYWLWMGIAFVLGNIMSRLILTVFYYLIVTPIALVMRLSGRDKLGLRRTHGSRWVDIPKGGTDYERQF